MQFLPLLFVSTLVLSGCLARDIGGLLGVFGGGAGGILSGYTKTPEGKVVVGAMTDAFNQLVRVVKNYRPQESSGPQGHGTGGSLKVN